MKRGLFSIYTSTSGWMQDRESSKCYTRHSIKPTFCKGSLLYYTRRSRPHFFPVMQRKFSQNGSKRPILQVFCDFFKFPALFSKRSSWDFLGTFYLFLQVLYLLETLEYFSIFCFYNQIQWFRDLTCQETFSILLWIFKGNSVWLRDE